eukprot:8294259-Heterocapsa_arctica.AAC.1
MKGIPIGGVFSAVCVVLVLDWCEATWCETGSCKWAMFSRGWPAKNCIQWLSCGFFLSDEGLSMLGYTRASGSRTCLGGC